MRNLKMKLVVLNSVAQSDDLPRVVDQGSDSFLSHVNAHIIRDEEPVRGGCSAALRCWFARRLHCSHFECWFHAGGSVKYMPTKTCPMADQLVGSVTANHILTVTLPKSAYFYSVCPASAQPPCLRCCLGWSLVSKAQRRLPGLLCLHPHLIHAPRIQT
jgi:hypothetical protein